MRPIAISCGDPAGIGPEVAVKAWAALRDELPLIWIGDPQHLPDGTPWTAVSDPTTPTGDRLAVWPIPMGPAPVSGQPDLTLAAGVVAAIEAGGRMATDGSVAALCTAPIAKKVLAEGAGFAHPGHTEFLAHLAGGADVVMMLACDALRVVPATIHIPLADVPAALTPALLERTIRITHAGLIRDCGIATPRIAVAGLNPHAGEGGRMGRQEMDWIAPLITRLAAEGLAITGPHPADTLFHAAARARYDVAVCAYHDQALIPIKTLDFAGGVNVTLGLPFIRTSPDHGTAFDIAGRGVADPSSMIAALRMAAGMAAARGCA
jgi:4-hydroxythreonine-4-phosphate dehydrogenase